MDWQRDQWGAMDLFEKTFSANDCPNRIIKKRITKMLDFDLKFEKKNYYLTQLTPRTNQEAPSIMHTDARSIHPSVSEKDTVPALEIIIS